MVPDDAALTQICIVDCLECYTLCRQAAAQHAGPRSELHDIEHLRLLDDCADACRAAADFLLRGSRHSAACCALCADICDACASSCEALAGAEPFAEACRGCARSCRAVAATSAAARHPADSTRGVHRY